MIDNNTLIYLTAEFKRLDKHFDKSIYRRLNEGLHVEISQSHNDLKVILSMYSPRFDENIEVAIFMVFCDYKYEGNYLNYSSSLVSLSQKVEYLTHPKEFKKEIKRILESYMDSDNDEYHEVNDLVKIESYKEEKENGN